MSTEEICNWLVGQDYFKKEYKKLLVSSVKQQFFAPEESDEEIDWTYLLKCASVLAHSLSPKMQDVSLRVSQFFIQSKPSNDDARLNSAEFILNTLSNRRAISLASERGLLAEQEVSWRDSFVGNLNWIKEDIKNSVFLKDGSRINVNVFQKEFWEALEKYKSLSISAPTSAGKSHLVKQWVLQKIADFKKISIVYVVPTRALIAEVQADFQRSLSEEIKASKVSVTSFPFAQFSDGDKPCIYILTQERLQLLLLNKLRSIDILIVDEAYKIADNERGILLQHVIEKAVLLNPSMRTIYISPQAANPEILIETEDNGYSRKFEDVTVNQNLIWVRQRRGIKWNLELCYNEEIIPINDITLESTPSPDSQRLPMIAYTLGQDGGNILYVNGASDAEKAAEQICDLIGFDNQVSDQRLSDLIELCQKVIHREYKLIECLKYAVGFHYGNIPLLIREEIENLFREGVIKYLVCTSTLVEGVNLPCKNIFIRSPKRGSGNPMSAEDFWNLAGRAGRWGKDFQGNILCIDPEKWDAPKKKTLMPITKATEEAIKSHEVLIEFIQSGTPRIEAATKEKRILESMTSYLAISSKTYGGVKEIPWIKKISQDKVEQIENAVNDYLSVEDVPDQIIENHPGISPIAMRDLLNYFKSHTGNKENLLVPYATDTDAVAKYAAIFKVLFNRLTNEFGGNDGYMFRQAIVTVHWMQGRTIKRIIEERKKALPNEEIHKTIREVLQDIESVARYKAPKYLSCYNDLLKYYFESIGEKDLADEIEDITLYLEMGVNTMTQLALLNLGLSRTSAVEIKEYITADHLSERDCLEWFMNPNNNWRSRDVPALVKREIERMLEMHVSQPGIQIPL